MKILIVGLGSIGRRHLTNLRLVEPNSSIVIWHQKSKSDDVSGNPPEADHVVYSLDDALAMNPDVALVTCPTSLHVETCLALAQQNIHLFVEKPLSNTLDNVDRLLDVCRERSLVLMVGYNMRFYPPLQVMRHALTEGRIGRLLSLRAEVGQYLPDWRPDSDYRRGVSARHDLGGGVVLELSHELDYVRWLMGEVSAISAQVDRLSDLAIDVEDIAEIILRFSTGAIGSIHLDMLQHSATRTCRVIGTKGTLTWDGSCHQVRLFSSTTHDWSDLHPATQIERNDMYIGELRHFLDCVKENRVPVVAGNDGKRVLEIALAVKQSSLEQRVVQL